MLTIASWNHGQNTLGVRHIDDAWRFLLEDLHVDVGLVQETTIPEWVERTYGVTFLKLWPKKTWGSAVVTRTKSHDVVMKSVPLRLVAVRASVPELGEAILSSMHAGIVDNRVIPGLRRSIEGLIPLVQGRRFAVGGDLNTARAAHAFWPTYGHGDFWGWMEGIGWHDCVWESLGEERKTLWSPGSRPLQADHMFVDRITGESIEEVEILGEDRVSQLSDHAVVVVHISSREDSPGRAARGKSL